MSSGGFVNREVGGPTWVLGLTLFHGGGFEQEEGTPVGRLVLWVILFFWGQGFVDQPLSNGSVRSRGSRPRVGDLSVDCIVRGLSSNRYQCVGSFLGEVHRLTSHGGGLYGPRGSKGSLQRLGGSFVVCTIVGCISSTTSYHGKTDHSHGCGSRALHIYLFVTPPAMHDCQPFCKAL